MVDDVVTNPVTDEEVMVVELFFDPEEAPTDPLELAFVKTEDNYLILVKNAVDDVIYAKYDGTGDLVSMTVVASDVTAKTVDLRAEDGTTDIVAYAYSIPEDSEGADPYEDFSSGADGVRIVN